MKAHHLLLAVLFAPLLLAEAAPCPVCAQYENAPFHDAKVTRGGRCKRGTIPKGCIPLINKSADWCMECQAQTPFNSPSGFRRCPRCHGKGEVPDPAAKPGSASAPVAGPAEPATPATAPADSPAAPVVAVAEVKRCELCGPDGTVAAPPVDCDICEAGYSHKREGDKFLCRLCGKACASRFAPCCKPDCPKCAATRSKRPSCPVCGGDKVITPMEEQRLQAKPAP